MTKVKETDKLKEGLRIIAEEKHRLADIQMLLDAGLTVDRKDIKWLLEKAHEALQDKQHEIF